MPCRCAAQSFSITFRIGVMFCRNADQDACGLPQALRLYSSAGGGGMPGGAPDGGGGGPIIEEVD